MLHTLWSFLLVLIASSLMVTATVHAREASGPSLIECSGAVHSEGDTDQSQGDADKAIPHHHGNCLGSSLNVPATAAFAFAPLTVGLRPSAWLDSETPSHSVDPMLRPPAA